MCRSSFEPQEGSNKIPETTQEAQKEARDGTQKRTKGNLEEVRSLILRFDLLRLGRLLAAGTPTLNRQVSEVICSGSGRA